MLEEFTKENELDALKQRLQNLENEITGLNPRNFAGIRSDDLLLATVQNAFGDGSDGDVTISSNTTLTRDMFYKNLTINLGIVLTTASFRIFVQEQLLNKGTIQNNGNTGGNGGVGGDSSGGSGGAGGTAGAAGAALTAGSLPVGAAGTAGGAGGAGGGSGAGGTVGTVGGT